MFTKDQFTVYAEKLFTDEVSKEKESHFMQQQILCHFVKAKVTKDARVKQNAFRKSVNAKLHVLSATLNVFHLSCIDRLFNYTLIAKFARNCK